MEGFEITGGSSRCVFHQSDDLTLRDLVVHDCPAQGILGADWGSGSLTVEHSEVYRCGGGDRRAPDLHRRRTRTTTPTASSGCSTPGSTTRNGGNNVKSRAARNEIYYNRIEGAYYHELELIGAECCAEDVVREDSDVVGNLFIKKGSNADFYVTRFGGDGTGQTWGRYRFVNNTVIVSGTSAVFRLFDGLESVEMHNNVFYRSGGAGHDRAHRRGGVGERRAASPARTTGSSTGSTSVPTQWTGTLTGIEPRLHQRRGRRLLPRRRQPPPRRGQRRPSRAPSGSPFPDPLFPPAFHPPGTPGAFGTPNPRPVDGADRHRRLRARLRRLSRSSPSRTSP